MAWWEWVALFFATATIGFAKTAIGGAGTLAVVIFAFVLPARESTGVLLPLLIFRDTSLLTVVGVGAGIWVTLSSLIEPVARAIDSRSVRLTQAQWGMFIAHLGVGLFIVGASVTSAFNVERDVAVRVGERFEAAGYELEFLGVREVTGPNFVAQEGQFELRRGGEYIGSLRPQKRTYRVRTSPMTEAAIDTRMVRDVFVSLGDPLGGGSWSVHFRYKPMISFIWYGCIVMALGGLIAATDRRYRRPIKSRAAARSTAEPTIAAEEGA